MHVHVKKGNFIYGPGCGELLHLLLFKITSKLVCTLLMTSMALAEGFIYVLMCCTFKHRSLLTSFEPR